MLPGPIFNIEMLTGARRTRFYWIRAIYGSILLFALWAEYPHYYLGQGNGTLTIGQIAAFAATFFTTFSVLQVLMVLLVGPALVAPAICVERERRTIEYLFATDLTNSEIVLGKLLARAFDITYAVLVGMPILALAGLLGGIDSRQLLATFVVTASTMLCVALAIAVSVRSFRVRNALGQVYVLLFLLLVVPLVVQELLREYQILPWLVPLNDAIVEANPLMTLSRTVLANYRGTDPWVPIGRMVLSQAVLTVGLTALSVLSLRNVHVKAAGKSPRSQRRPRLFDGPVNDRPMLWKELRENRMGAHGWFGWIAGPILALLAITPIAWAFYEHVELHGLWHRRDTTFDTFGQFSSSMLMMVLIIGLILIGVRAAGSITSEREKDTWIGLLSTPLAAGEIATGKIVGQPEDWRVVACLLGAGHGAAACLPAGCVAMRWRVADRCDRAGGFLQCAGDVCFACVAHDVARAGDHYVYLAIRRRRLFVLLPSLHDWPRQQWQNCLDVVRSVPAFRRSLGGRTNERHGL